jgi:hypothetical protein
MNQLIRLATASDKGTLVRVWDTYSGQYARTHTHAFCHPHTTQTGATHTSVNQTVCDKQPAHTLTRQAASTRMPCDVCLCSTAVPGELLQELRRGADRATIYSIAFNHVRTCVCVCVCVCVCLCMCRVLPVCPFRVSALRCAPGFTNVGRLVS